MLTIKSVNKAIAEVYPEYEIVRGKDYFWVYGPNTESWNTTMIYCSKINHLTLGQWLEEVTHLMEANTK